jgi:beta-lactamase class A
MWRQKLAKYQGKILPILTLGVGVFIGLYIHRTPTADDFRILRVGQQGLINPIIGCVATDANNFGQFNPLAKKITDLIDTEKKSGDITDAAVYFQELDSGEWVGINETTNFYPASLFKVPVLIAYLKLAETDPDILKSTIPYTDLIDQSDDRIQEFVGTDTLVVGKSYAVDDLLRRMIVESDNRAYAALISNLDKSALLELLSNLGITPPQDDSNYAVSARAFSRFFRVLYNATYLNREMSQRALQLLSETDFKDGLAAGVPTSTTVSHKFGEYGVEDNSGESQLHDCGIVYYTKPYFLCVMTKGSDVNKLKTAIQKTSSLVYDEATKGYK